jgi:CelD/BcsL family acetyltransferase involved in cellulose biosynthesis
VELIVYQDTTVFDELRSEWNDLLGRAPINNIFYTWEWHSTWWDAYQPGELLILACRHDGKLVGIAPLFIANEAQGKVVRIIGCVDVTDYLDVIVDKDHLKAVYSAFAEYFTNNRNKFDLLDFCNIPQGSVTNEIFAEILKQHGFETDTQQQEVCPVIELPNEWGGYLGLLDKKQRHEVRRKLRRIHGTSEDVDWYIVNGKQNLDSEIACFMQLMAASDPEKEEFLQDEQHVKFFKNIVPLIHECGWLQMNFLTVGDERVASYINFVYDNRVLVYNSGLNHQTYGQLSPGIVLLAYNIQHAIENGYKAYDFLRGDETYKYRMGGQDTAVMNITAQ